MFVYIVLDILFISRHFPVYRHFHIFNINNKTKRRKEKKTNIFPFSCYKCCLAICNKRTKIENVIDNIRIEYGRRKKILVVLYIKKSFMFYDIKYI